MEHNSHVGFHFVFHSLLLVFKLIEQGAESLFFIAWLLLELLLHLVVCPETIVQFSLALSFDLELLKKISNASSLILDELLFLSLCHNLILIQQLFHVLLTVLKVVTHLCIGLDLALLLPDLGLLLLSQFIKFQCQVLLDFPLDIFSIDFDFGFFGLF